MFREYAYSICDRRSAVEKPLGCGCQAAAAHWGWCVFAHLICNMPPSNSISYLYVCHSSHLLEISSCMWSPEWILLYFCVRGGGGVRWGGGGRVCVVVYVQHSANEANEVVNMGRSVQNIMTSFIA